VVFKPGQVRIAHFAHRPDAGCAFGARMSLAHLTAQGRIARALRARGLDVELEAPILGDSGARRIDVLTWPPDRPQARVAIEVQPSDLGAEAISARTASYQQMGVAPLWLRLLDFASFPAVQTLPLLGSIWIERYRARSWERWAHDQLGDRLWFMDSGTGLVWRGLFVAAHRFRERALLHNDSAETRGRAADWTEARQWVDLQLEGPFPLEAMKLGRGDATGGDGGRRRFAWFVPPGEQDRRPPFAPEVRAVFTTERIGESRSLQVQVQGSWLAAASEGARSDWRTQRQAPRAALGAITRR
jgi:competence protein CoiA